MRRADFYESTTAQRVCLNDSKVKVLLERGVSVSSREQSLCLITMWNSCFSLIPGVCGSKPLLTETDCFRQLGKRFPQQQCIHDFGSQIGGLGREEDPSTELV